MHVPFIFLTCLTMLFSAPVTAFDNDIDDMKPMGVSDLVWSKLKTALPETKIVPNPPGIGGQLSHFGSSLSVDGSRVLIGAPDMDGTGLVYVLDFDGFSWQETAVLKPSDGISSDRFGISVSLLGDTALIGADGVDLFGINSGAAYIYTFDGSQWVQSQKLTPNSGNFLDQFGRSVSLSVNTALIGAENDDEVDSNAGAAYVFEFNGNNWLQTQKIFASDVDRSDRFGQSVSLSGSKALIGAYNNDDNGSNSGSAYAFEFDGNTWSETQKITASDADSNDLFGYPIHLNNDRAIIGASGSNESGTSAGAAYVFDFSGAMWNEVQKLTASDGAENDQFGKSVSLFGDQAIIGALMHDGNGSESGAAYIFEIDNGNWVQTQKLESSDGSEGDNFGNSISISNNAVLVGAFNNDDNSTASGSAYYYSFDNNSWSESQILTSVGGSSFKRLGGSVSLSENRAFIGSYGENDFTGSVLVYDFDGKNWNFSQKITADDGQAGAWFGISVSHFGDRVLIGAETDDNNDTGSGAAYIFDYDGSSWIQTHKLVATDGANFDFFGESVSLSNNRAAIGSSRNDQLDNDAGSTYIFDFDGKNWSQSQKLLASDGTQRSRFGKSVSLYEDRVVIGAYSEDGNETDSGAVYVFDFDGSTWLESQKLIASDGLRFDRFGWSTSLFADKVIIGAYRKDDMTVDEGAAYIFSFDGANWNEEKKLKPNDNAELDNFGRSVQLLSNQALIGANFKTNDNDKTSGAAYIFTFYENDWTQTQKFDDPNGSSIDFFGESVSLFADKVLIGASGVDDHGGESGAAYIFKIPDDLIFENGFE